MKCKKLMALLLAATLTASAGSGVVLADTYSDTEKDLFAESLSTFITQYQQELVSRDGLASGVHADLELQLTDTGRALAGLASAMNLSWLENIGLGYDVSFADGMEAVVADVTLNGSKICSLEVYMNLETLETYVRIPELNDAYLMADTSGGEEIPEAVRAYLDSMSDPAALLPDSQLLEDVLNRYSEILFEGFNESISGKETISLHGIEAECTTLEGQMYQEDAVAFAQELLTVFRDDEPLQEFIGTWTALDPELEESYDEFLDSLDDTLDSLEYDPETEDGSYISSKIWLDEDKQIIGRQFSLCSDSMTIPLVTWLAPSTEEASGFSLLLNSDDSTIELYGSGTITDAKLTGTYALALDGVDLAVIDVVDADKAGNGSCKLRLTEGIGNDYYRYLGSLSMILDYASGADGLENLALTAAASDVPIVTLSISGEMTDPLEIPDFASLPNVLDAASDADTLTYLMEMNWIPILENCIAAGMPEELASMIDQYLYNAIYEVEFDSESYDFYELESEDF